MLIFVHVYNSLSNVGSRKTSRDVTTHVDDCLTIFEIYDHVRKKKGKNVNAALCRLKMSRPWEMEI